MRKLLLGTAFAASCLGSSSASAGSLATDAFVTNVRINAYFLGKASVLAADRSENTGLRLFAGEEAVGDDALLASLDARTPLEIAHNLPLNIASNDVVTGRSAAVDEALEDLAFKAPEGSGALMPAAIVTLDRLSSSKGQAFDTLYKATQINALRQLAGVFNAYSMTGDDVMLKQLAKSELSATNDRIAEISRF